MNPSDIFVISAVRSAIGSFGGSLKDVPPIQLATDVCRAAIERSGLAPEHIGHAVMGHVIRPKHGMPTSPGPWQ